MTNAHAKTLYNIKNSKQTNTIKSRTELFFATVAFPFHVFRLLSSS